MATRLAEGFRANEKCQWPHQEAVVSPPAAAHFVGMTFIGLARLMLVRSIRSRREPEGLSSRSAEAPTLPPSADRSIIEIGRDPLRCRIPSPVGNGLGYATLCSELKSSGRVLCSLPFLTHCRQQLARTVLTDRSHRRDRAGLLSWLSRTPAWTLL